MKAVGRGRQRGLTITGFLFVAIVVVAVAMVGFRVIPSYIEYYAVQKALEETMRESTTLSQTEIRRSMERRMDVNYVDAVRAGDIDVTKEGSEVVASVSWERRLHMVANAYILLEFNASARR